jgi:hypothetical protein
MVAPLADVFQAEEDSAFVRVESEQNSSQPTFRAKSEWTKRPLVRAREEQEDETVTELLGAAGECHQEANDGHRESRKGHKPDGMRRRCRRAAHMPLRAPTSGFPAYLYAA